MLFSYRFHPDRDAFKVIQADKAQGRREIGAKPAGDWRETGADGSRHSRVWTQDKTHPGCALSGLSSSHTEQEMSKSDGTLATVTLADSATKLDDRHRDTVLVCASHGGVYAAYLAARHGCRAAIFSDAGVGKDDAGIAGLGYCDRLGMAAAAVSVMTARIGDVDDIWARGVISHVNATARALGCEEGMSTAIAAQTLTAAPRAHHSPPPYEESRKIFRAHPGEPRVICIDSASLVCPEDAGQIVITGSHGGLVGGAPEMALRTDALLAVFNDAGVGIDNAGTTRLPALDKRGIAAATVAADSARIGDAVSTLNEGVISRVNATAQAFGAHIGMTTRALIDMILGTPALWQRSNGNAPR